MHAQTPFGNKAKPSPQRSSALLLDTISTIQDPAEAGRIVLGGETTALRAFPAASLLSVRSSSRGENLEGAVSFKLLNVLWIVKKFGQFQAKISNALKATASQAALHP